MLAKNGESKTDVLKNQKTVRQEQEMTAEESGLCRPGGFQLTERLFSFAKETKRSLPLTVVDVGCGTGAAMRYLRKRYPDWQICGIDPQADRIYPAAADLEETDRPKGNGASGEKAEYGDSRSNREEQQAERLGEVPVFYGEAEALPFAAHSVDVILMECSFSKTWNPEQALNEVLRVLKPEGWLLMSDLYARREAVCTELQGLIGRLETHQMIFGRLRRAGFAVLEMQDCSGELTQWIGQKILDGTACELYQGLGVDRETLKRAGCGYLLCAAKPSGLWETLNYAVENSPFYREKCGWNTEKTRFSVGDWAGFSRLPFSHAEEIRENPDRFVCVSPKEIARIITLRTSGSQGNSKRLFFTEADLLRTADFFEKGMQYLIQSGERVTVYMEGPGRFSVGGLMKEGLARIGSEVIVHGLIRDLEAAAKDADGSACLVGVPSQMYALACQAPWLRPKTVLLSADYVPESIKSVLEASWRCRVFTHWGMTETGYGGGVQCGAREGYHLRDEDLLLEVVNPETGMPVPDGEEGELVLTTLKRKGMPLIRYRTGDMGRMLTERCGCGCLKPRLAQVKGRLDDSFLLSDGRRLSMHRLDELLFGIDGVQDFQAELSLEAPVGQADDWAAFSCLSLFVMPKRGLDEAEKKAVLEKIRVCLEREFSEILRIEIAEKEISPYIGSGKRKLLFSLLPV